MFQWWTNFWYNRSQKSIEQNIGQLEQLIEPKKVNIQEIINSLESLKRDLYEIVDAKDKAHQSRVSNAILGIGQAVAYAYKLLGKNDMKPSDIEALKSWIKTIVQYHQGNIIEHTGQLQEASS